jgi:hypothetical protein
MGLSERPQISTLGPFLWATKNPPVVNGRHLLHRLDASKLFPTAPDRSCVPDLNLLFATPTNDRRRSIGEMKHQLFLIVVGSSIVMSMTGWLYALGWVALKLIRFV